ncbi:MAG: ATP-binding cassette domain-containing protein [Candidatus Andersenbacteria bacterium]|nr:ATP-binding cassette domain-containing protein [bacterium]MDZ4225422.1 ATP-binding cassette domain-containing protein [Candidatus Andersenbacteria bacterium]
MEDAPSFIEVSKIYAEYSAGNRSLKRLLGRAPQTHSVLRDLSFKLSIGDQVTLFGLPGSGKTTLLRLLAGIIQPSSGKLTVNGQPPLSYKDLAAGYVSIEESEPAGETVHDILYTFGRTHDITSLPARLGEVAEQLGLSPALNRPARTLATTERLRLNLARAALSDTPLLLLDDTADQLGTDFIREILTGVFDGRTAIVATRFASTAERLDQPIFILHQATLAQSGTRDEMAATVGCQRVLEVWIEGLRYDLLRQLKKHAGVTSVRLLPTTQFSGQKLRVVLRSSRYLPSFYDLISQAPLVRVEELPPSLNEIISRL